VSLKIKNLIILATTGLWIVIILIPILLPAERGGKISPTMVIPPLPPKESSAGEGVVSPSPAVPPESMEEAWSRDPFSLPAGIRAISGEGTEGQTASADVVQESKLTAIIRRGNTALATINRQVVQEGDIVNGEKVIKIGKSSITLLARDGSTRALNLYENLPSVQVTVPKRGK